MQAASSHCPSLPATAILSTYPYLSALLTDLSFPQLSPQELREVVTAFNDTNEPKAVQATGLHLAGEKYFVLKADEKSLYGKKVRLISSQKFVWEIQPPSLKRGRLGADLHDSYPTGQRRRRDRQDQANPPHHTLPGNDTAGPSGHDGGEAGGLFGRHGVLKGEPTAPRDGIWNSI